MGEPKTSSQLAEKLGIYESAVRRHLLELESKGLVSSFFKRGIGRPKKYYTITICGRELFPKQYDLLLGVIISKLNSRYGSAFVEGLFKDIIDELSTKLNFHIDEENFDARAVKVVELLNKLGYRAHLKNDAKNAVIQLKDCPYCEIAKLYPNLICAFDADFISRTLKVPKLHLLECIAQGSNACTFVLVKEENERS